MRNQTCKYFEQGRCFKGSNCKFAHISPSDSRLTKFTSASHLATLSTDIKNDLKDFDNFQSSPFSSFGFPSPAITNLIDGSRKISFEELRVQFHQDPSNYSNSIQLREEDYKKALEFLKQNYDKAARYLQLAAKEKNSLKPFIPFSINEMNPSFGSSGFGSSGTPAFGSSGFGQSAFGQSGFGQSAFGKSAFSQNDTTQKSTPFGAAANSSSPFGGLAENKGSVTPFGSNSAFAGSNPFAKAASSNNAFGAASNKGASGAVPTNSAFGATPTNNAFSNASTSNNALASAGSPFAAGNTTSNNAGNLNNAFGGSGSTQNAFLTDKVSSNAFSSGNNTNNNAFSTETTGKTNLLSNPSGNTPASVSDMSEAVMAAFQNATFELGKVPDVPPPANLCQG